MLSAENTFCRKCCLQNVQKFGNSVENTLSEILCRKYFLQKRLSSERKCFLQKKLCGKCFLQKMHSVENAFCGKCFFAENVFWEKYQRNLFAENTFCTKMLSVENTFCIKFFLQNILSAEQVDFLQKMLSAKKILSIENTF